jgi:hypothetical protein
MGKLIASSLFSLDVAAVTELKHQAGRDLVMYGHGSSGRPCASTT